jgi:hypothetical protein
MTPFNPNQILVSQELRRDYERTAADWRLMRDAQRTAARPNSAPARQENPARTPPLQQSAWSRLIALFL